MNRLYNLFLLGRLLKRLYFEGGGLYFKNQKDLSIQEKNLLNDSEIVNNKAYELCAKLNFSFLDIYWKDVFNLINNNDKVEDKKYFLKQVNSFYQQINFSIETSISDDDLIFFQMGSIMSEQWIRMIASHSIIELRFDLNQFRFPSEFSSTKFEKINRIIKKVEKIINAIDLVQFNSISEELNNEIEKIKIDKADEMYNKRVEHHYYKIENNGIFNIGNGNTSTQTIEQINSELKTLLDKLKKEVAEIKIQLSSEDKQKIDKILARLEEDVNDKDCESVGEHFERISKIASVTDVGLKIGEIASKIITLLS